MDIGRISSLASDEVMSLSELKEDAIFRKIPENMILELINEALEKGYKASERIIKEYGDSDIYEICSSKGIKVNIVNRGNTFKFLRVRAEYEHSKKKLTIYKSSIDEMMNQLEGLKFFGKPLDVDIIKIHLAHELYHYLEYEEIGLTNEELPRISLFQLGSFRRLSTVIKTREIAAHAFCRKLLSLPFHPKLIDFLYLVNRGEIAKEWLEEYLKEIEGTLKKLGVC